MAKITIDYNKIVPRTILQQCNTRNMNKAAKRRAKKRTAKDCSGEKPQQVSEDPISILRNQMETAKAEGNHSEISSLRQKIWLLQDANAGVRSDITAEQLDVILLEKEVATRATINFASKPSSATDISLDECRKEIVEKKLRKLLKKKEEVKKLKERMARGEKLEQTQIMKTERETEICDEIEECEDELFQIKKAIKQESQAKLDIGV